MLPHRTYRTVLTGTALVKTLSAQEKELISGANANKKGVLLAKVTGKIDSTAASGDYYVHLYNATEIPADGTIDESQAIPVTFLMHPQKIEHITGTDSTFDIDFTPDAIKAKRGVILAISTTEFTKTLVGTAVMAATIIYH